MTFAIVRNGKIAAHAEHATLASLRDWLAGHGRSGELVLLDLRDGEVPRIGARVTVTEVLASVARMREAPDHATLCCAPGA